MASGAKKIGNTFVWILLGLLIVGLAGFGATNFSGTVRTIGSVGSVSISTDEYARALQNQLRSYQAQTGSAAQISQLTALGLDRLALEQIVISAAIDSEVESLGISVGDEELQREILAYPAFQGIDGSFDRNAYAFTLEQAGLNEAEFEEDIRAGRARQIVEEAVLASIVMPETFVDQVVEFAGARRNFTWAVVNPSTLPELPATATQSELQSYYNANTDAFMLPETRQITYAWLTPSMLLDSVDVDEADLTRLYEDRAADYNLPERRLVERLVFGDEAAARDALAQIEAGTATFETFVSERGLSLTDVDLGDVEIGDLGTAGDAVFSAEVGAVVGPFDTNLGPALFNIGGILEARVTTFQEVRDALREDLARDRAVRMIERMAQDVDDLLAGGATLEELPDESEMQTATIAFNVLSEDEIAAYDAFRETAQTVTQDDYPEVDFLEDGGIFALRLDEVVAPRPEPFEDAQDKVAEVVAAERMTDALTARANEIVTQLAVTGDFATQGLSTRVENGLTRTAYIDGTPIGFMEQVFEMERGDINVIAGDGAVVLVQLNDILPPDDTADLSQLRDALQLQLSQGLAQDIYAAFSRDAFLRADRNIDQRAVDAVNHSFQ